MNAERSPKFATLVIAIRGTHVIPNAATRFFPAHVFVRRVAQRGISLRFVPAAQISKHVFNPTRLASSGASEDLQAHEETLANRRERAKPQARLR
jgi:hypothetical protein